MYFWMGLGINVPCSCGVTFKVFTGISNDVRFLAKSFRRGYELEAICGVHVRTAGGSSF